MNKDNAKDFLPLVQALAEGKNVQFKTGLDWNDGDNFSFDSHISNYRIKPEPIKKWYRVAMMRDGTEVADDESDELYFGKNNYFIKWLTPRVEYIVEE